MNNGTCSHAKRPVKHIEIYNSCVLSLSHGYIILLRLYIVFPYLCDKESLYKTPMNKSKSGAR